MHRSRYAILPALLLAAALSACGGSDDDSDSGDNQSGGADSTAQFDRGDKDNSGDLKPSDDDASPATDASGEDASSSADSKIESDQDDEKESDGAEGEDDGGSATTDAPDEDTSPSAGSKEDPDSDDAADPDDTDQGADAPDEDTSSSDGDPSNEDKENSAPNGSSDHDSDLSNGSTTAHFRVIDEGTRRNQSVSATIGQVFARGAVAADQTVAAAVDGQRIPTQVNKKATWSDGSLRHAVITVRLPDGAVSANPVVDLKTTAEDPDSTPVSLGQLLATDFDATVSLEINGTQHKISARDLLSRARQRGTCSAWAHQCKRWLSGPLASEWIVGGPIAKNGKTPSHLGVYFHVRAYADSSGQISRVRVDSVIENDWAYVPYPSNQRYDAKITVGTQTFDAKDLKHYRQARWHKVLWWHGAPKVYARVDTNYLQSTGAVSNYADLKVSDKFLSSLPSKFAPMSHGNQTRHMGNTGAQSAIGPLPRWTTTYVVSGARGALEWMLANDNAVGSYRFHYRDRETGRPLSIADHPYVTLANKSYARRASKYTSSSRGRNYKADLLPTSHSDCKSPYKFNIAHHPSIGYVPYLVTGDYYYLEEMQFTASYIELWPNEGYRQHSKGRLRKAQSQTRGQAWALRSIADAAFATPDDDPLKTAFEDQVAANIADYTKYYIDKTARHPLHVVDDGGAVIYSSHGQRHVAIAPWQADFFTWTVGHIAEQGFDGARRFLKWLSVFPIQRMTDWLRKPDTGYCWLVASTYKLQVRPSSHGEQYDTLAQAYKNTLNKLYGLKCNSQQYVNELGNSEDKTYKRGQMSGYAYSTTGFPSNFQIALAMAADSGLPKARKAWSIFDSRSVKPDYNNYPNFAVEPRFEH